MLATSIIKKRYLVKPGRIFNKSTKSALFGLIALAILIQRLHHGGAGLCQTHGPGTGKMAGVIRPQNRKPGGQLQRLVDRIQ